MPIKNLLTRANSKCELCTAKGGLEVFEVTPSDGSADQCALVCENCRDQMQKLDKPDLHHWRCLGDAMWNEASAVKVLAWRLLDQLSDDAWARDQLEMIYLDEEEIKWAKSQGEPVAEGDIIHKDGNGAILSSGDAVTLIKDLNVKGAGFTAKRGTTVRNISLVPDNAGHIEGRIQGQQIVILTKFVKKAN